MKITLLLPYGTGSCYYAVGVFDFFRSFPEYSPLYFPIIRQMSGFNAECLKIKRRMSILNCRKQSILPWGKRQINQLSQE
jgi:hypothetical protein